jgi:hypothetical protein
LFHHGGPHRRPASLTKENVTLRSGRASSSACAARCAMCVANAAIRHVTAGLSRRAGGILHRLVSVWPYVPRLLCGRHTRHKKQSDGCRQHQT